MQLIQADVFTVLIMNEHKNLTNVVIGKLGKLVHKQNCTHDFFILQIITSLLYKLDTLLLNQKKRPVLYTTSFFFRIRIHPIKETR